MSKTLLIHHDNVPDGMTIKKIKFDYKNSKETPSVDTYISKKILPTIDKDTELIFIKDNLSSSYLELYGLVVAYHIRLSENLGNTRYIPIVIRGDIDACTLNKLAPIANILFTKNIFLEPNTVETIEEYKVESLSSLSEEDYKTHFLDRIAIEPPENSSNHSIANNWAIDRWSRFVGAKSDAISDNKEKIENMLYFKYLLALNPIEKKKGINHIPKQPQGDGTILYIDDEWNKGWSDILSHYFSKNSTISFETFEHEFQDINLDSLKSEVTKKIEALSPDIVILDLRLLKNDLMGTNREDIGKYSGIQISSMIKEINPGIQIIMLTATGNSLILEKLYEHGILGYIKKEHPEDKSLKTKDNIRKLAELVTEGFEKKYLKKIWELQKEIVSLDIFKNQDFQAMKFEIETIFELLDSNLDKRYTYAMLSVFQSLEEINNYYIDDRTKEWKDGHTEISIEGIGYTKQKIVAVLKRLELFEEFSSDIDEISRMRKNVIHPPEDGNTEQPTQNNIITWFTMLCEILKKMDTDA